MMKKINDGNFEYIINRYYKTLFSIALNYTHNTFDAEDVVQNTFIKLYTYYQSIKNEEHLKNWLIRSVINQCINVSRKRKKLIVNSDYIDNMMDEQNNISKSSPNEIYEYINKLRNNYKTIIILYYYDNRSIKEIASILGISETNAATRLDRARQQLKKLLLESGCNYDK